MVDKVKQREAAVAALWNGIAAAAGANLAITTYRGLAHHLSSNQSATGSAAGDAFSQCGPNSGHGGAALYIDGLCLAFGATQTLGRLAFGAAHTGRLIKSSLPSQQPDAPLSASAAQQSKEPRRMVWSLSAMESSLSCIGHLLQGEFTYQSCNPASWPLIFNSVAASLAALTLCKGFRSSVDQTRNLDMSAVQMADGEPDLERGDIKRDTDRALRGIAAGDRTLAHVLAGVGLLCWSVNAYMALSNADEQATGLAAPSKTYTFADLPTSQKVETYASFAIGALGVVQGCAIGLNSLYRQHRNGLYRDIERNLHAAWNGALSITDVGPKMAVLMPYLSPRQSATEV